MMRSALLIANPKAGRGGPESRREAIPRFCGLMKARGVSVDVRTTTGPYDAARLAAEAARDGFREVIVSGGDGTINEALQGLVGNKVGLVLWHSGMEDELDRE